MGKQFASVSARYGAPMGRGQCGTPENAGGKIRLFAVRLDSGGYDDGGAYWGVNSGGRFLFCACDDSGDYRQFVRAASRAHAALLLDLKPEQLAKPFKAIRFGRFAADWAYIGKAFKGFLVTEFGKPVATCDNYADLCAFAQEKEGAC